MCKAIGHNAHVHALYSLTKSVAVSVSLFYTKKNKSRLPAQFRRVGFVGSAMKVIFLLTINVVLSL